MGLLYVSGIPLHDEDQELINRASQRHKLARHIPLVNDGETYADIFDDGRRTVGYRSLSDDVRECARKRAEQSDN